MLRLSALLGVVLILQERPATLAIVVAPTAAVRGDSAPVFAMLQHALADVRQVRVLPRPPAFASSAAGRADPNAGRIESAQWILRAAIAPAGADLQVTLALVDVATGRFAVRRTRVFPRTRLAGGIGPMARQLVAAIPTS